MQKEKEIEYKFLVSEEEFNQFLVHFDTQGNNAVRKIQINYYYDTDDNMLNKKDVTVRVRQEQDKLKCQIKKHTNTSMALFFSDEYCGCLERLPKVLRVEGIHEELLLKGSLVTERREIKFGICGKLCFDISMYLGMIDYEIEVEYTERDKQSGEAIAAIIGLNTKASAMKSHRFFKQLEEISNEEGIVALY